MKKQQLITLLLIISLFFSYAQQSKIDSLKNEYKFLISDEKKLVFLKDLNKLMINESSFKNSKFYFEEMLRLAISEKNKKLEIRAYILISEGFRKDENYQKAEIFALSAIKRSDSLRNFLISSNQLGRVHHHFKEYKKAIKIYKAAIKEYNKRKGKFISIFTIYSNLGISYGGIGNVDEEIKSYLKASEYAEKFKNNLLKNRALYNLAWLYMNLEHYEKADKYFHKALKDSSKIKIKAYVYRNFHGLGINSSRWGKYKDAMKYNKIALNYYKKVGNRLYEFDVLNNIATVYQKMEKPIKELKYAKLALNVANQINNKFAICGAKLTLSEAYLNLNQYEEAKKHLLDIAKDTVNTKLISKQAKAVIYSNFYKIYKAKKEYGKSLEYLERYKMINDSLLTEKIKSNVAKIETKYQTEKKEKENLKLKNEATKKNLLIAQQKQKTTTLLTSLIALAILFFSGIFYFKQRQKTQKQQAVIDKLQAKENERNRLAGNVHDSLAGDLRTAMIQVDTINKELKNDKLEDVVNVIERAYNKTRTISQEYQKLNFSKIPFEKYVKSLLFERQELYSIIIDQEGLSAIDWKIINPEIKTEFYRILQEAFINIHKHAKASHVMVYFNLTNNNIQMEIKDDGIGLDITKSFESVGLSNIQARIKDLNGKLKIVSTPSNGFELLITVPV